jgi:site-specific DNA-cytosine methylase
VKELEFTVGFGFGGSGGGALGFQQAETHLLGVRAKFRHVGSFDHDEKACANYRYLTGHEETCVDARELTPALLRSIYGETAPDVFFASPPCQGASALLSEAKAATEHYQALNELAVVWTKLMLDTWSPGPRVVLFENVPRIISRASGTVGAVKALLKKAGYVWHDGTHELGNYAPGGHYDAGILGGLAQHRARWIGIARDPKRCAPLVYKPPARRVRAVGEVLGPLPMPGDPAGGPMHALPKLSPMNWLRLAMIPAGGDWRDIPGVLAEGQERREVFRRHHLSAWTEPAPTVGGPGSNGPQAVADPRIQCAPHAGAYGVVDWTESASTVTASLQVDNGRAAVADPRTTAFRDGYGVISWGEPSGTVTGQARPSNGAFAVADPRPSSGFG